MSEPDPQVTSDPGGIEVDVRNIPDSFGDVESYGAEYWAEHDYHRFDDERFEPEVE